MTSPRKFPEGAIFHICNKSIANYNILQNDEDVQRFINTVWYYNTLARHYSYSLYSEHHPSLNTTQFHLLSPTSESITKILTDTVMPDHYHLLAKVLIDNSLSKFISNIENSYSRYFNLKYNRKGPLWQSRFRAVKIKSNEQLLHVSRYIHLNATTNNLVKKPEDWKYSSYSEFISNPKLLLSVITEISIQTPDHYKQFVEDQIDYQKSLKRIKRLLLE